MAVVSSGEKSYDYDVFEDGIYKGQLQKVISDFSYNQSINTVGVELNIILGIPFSETGADSTADNLVTQAGDTIATPSGQNLLVDFDYIFNTEPINVGNTVIVTEYSDIYPSGNAVFFGRIVKWKANIDDGTIELTLFSYGYDMAQHVVVGDGSSAIVQNEYDTELTLTRLSGGTGVFVSQVINIVAETQMKSFSLFAKSATSGKTAPLVLRLWRGTPDNRGEIVASGIVFITSTTMGEVKIQYSVPKTLAIGDYFIQAYTFAVFGTSYTDVVVGVSSTDLYSGGAYWEGTTTNIATYTEDTAQDLAFIVSADAGSSIYSFSAVDSGDAVLTAMNLYNQLGGIVDYDSSTINTSGSLLYYEFSLATIKEIIDKGLSVAPSSYYYYVDVGTNVFYFKDRAIEPEHTLLRGYHLQNFQIERAMDSMVNQVFFVGGDTGGGTNLLLSASSEASRDKYGVWSTVHSDNRVTNQVTGDAIMSNIMSNNSEPKYRAYCTVSSEKYDISRIKVGQMIKIGNNGDVIDDLLLQVVEVAYSPYEVKLTLDQPLGSKYFLTPNGNVPSE